jgi:hypothetical protein
MHLARCALLAHPTGFCDVCSHVAGHDVGFVMPHSGVYASVSSALLNSMCIALLSCRGCSQQHGHRKQQQRAGCIPQHGWSAARTGD